MVGVPPYTPDTLGRRDHRGRPGVAALRRRVPPAAAPHARAGPGPGGGRRGLAGPARCRRRRAAGPALAKLAAVLGRRRRRGHVDVDLGRRAAGVLDALRPAATEGRRVAHRLLRLRARRPHHRGSSTPGACPPTRAPGTSAATATWRGGERLFRVDRIRRARARRAASSPWPTAAPARARRPVPRPDDPRVVLELAPRPAGWRDLPGRRGRGRRGTAGCGYAGRHGDARGSSACCSGSGRRSGRRRGRSGTAGRRASAARRILARYRS